MKCLFLLWASAAVLVAAACGSTVDTDDDGQGGAAAGGSGSGANVPGLSDCSLHADCIVIPASCCGSCGAATRSDSIAINKSKGSAYVDAVCPDDIGCPGCYSPGDPTLQATCDSGTCTIVDLHEHSAAACTSSEDCRIRTSDCCECGGATDEESLIAINKTGEADYQSLVCDDLGCPECAPVYPDAATANCNQAGFCEVVWNY